VLFPEGYVVPKGIICVNLVHAVWNDFIIPSRSKLKSLQDSAAPYLENLEGFHRTKFDDYCDGYVDACLTSDDLAPLNATDHPNHPEFGKKKEGVLSNLPTGGDLLKHHFDTQFDKQEEPITNQWITNASLVNFKQNIGRKFELVMLDGKIQEGIVFMNEGIQAKDNNNIAWYFRTNLDGTLSSTYDNFKFRWISDKPLQPITETQKDDCKEADERIKELENETITQGEQANVATGSVEELNNIFKNPYMDERQEMHQQTLSENNKLYGQLETIKRLAKIAIQHEDYEHMRVILKSIATGEI
jgi:hypothetical protein